MGFVIKFVLSCLPFLLFISCSINPVSGNQDFVLFSEEREIEIGKSLSSQVIQQVGLYNDKELQIYVEKVGNSLADISHRTNLVYRFLVLDSPDVNAFALPGGYIFLNRGLMSYLTNEQELAAVLGHELGHVTARHSITKASKAQLFDILTYAVGTRVGSTVSNLTSMMSGVLLAGYGREQELEADSLGAEYMSQVGYSSHGMLDTISILKEHELYSKNVEERRGVKPQTYHGVFSTHPSNDKRLQEIILLTGDRPSSTSRIMNESYLWRIDGMVYGDSYSSGIRRKNNFYHGELDFYLRSPKGWEIINTPNNLIFNSPKGAASISMDVIDQNKKETPTQYLNNVFPEQILEEKSLKLDNYPGSTAILIQGLEKSRVAVIFKDKKIFRFFGTSKKELNGNENYDKTFLSIIYSFRSLLEKEKLLAETLKIKIYRVDENDTYSSLAKHSPIPFDPESQLRLLNGDFPEGKLEAGKLIKLVK